MSNKLILTGFMCALLMSYGCGENNDSSNPQRQSLKLNANAYQLEDGSSLSKCSEYSSYGKGDHGYWVDPDGAGTGIEPFIVYCEEDYAVFESTSDPSFPHSNLSNITVDFFNDTEIDQINALRVIADEVFAESDLAITFESDTTSGGCGASPVIPSDVMSALTLPLTVGSDTTEALREFSGSSDQSIISFNSSLNQFQITAQSPGPGSCSDAIFNNFGVEEDVIVKQLTLRTYSDRARSYSSGTYYRIYVK